MPKDTPGNQLLDVYEQQGIKLRLDWASLPELFDWTNDQPNLQPDVTVASVFEQRYAIRVAQLCLWEAWHKAVVWLCEVANMDEGLPCPADYAMGMADWATCCALSLQRTFGGH